MSFRLQNDVLILIVGKKPLLVGTVFEGKKLLIMIKVVLFHLSTPIFFYQINGPNKVKPKWAER